LFDYLVDGPDGRAREPEETMKYLCLIYANESEMAVRREGDNRLMLDEYFTFTTDIKKNGKYVAGEALQPTSTATTVRVRSGKLAATDGPFAETKEQLGGFYLIDAVDLNEAIQIAGRIPGARTGCVEVRPVVVFANAPA
jgi:hypothetical protein